MTEADPSLPSARTDFRNRFFSLGPQPNTPPKMTKFLKLLASKQIIGRAPEFLYDTNWQASRHFADKPTTKVPSKIMMSPTSEKSLRVRRARPVDVPQVMRFVRDSTRACWPGSSDRSSSQVVLQDFVARALAQGHSMLAEKQESNRGWKQIQGLALSTATCPWDAAILEQWARCIKCNRSRDLMSFTAHCLRAPALHDKYRVHKILQVVLVVPPDAPKSSEIVQMLVKAAIRRGRDVGFPLLRFDVTNDAVAKALEDLNLTKEWQVSYNIVPEGTKGRNITHTDKPAATPVTPARPERRNSAPDIKSGKGNFIAVYTIFTKPAKT